MGDPNELEQSEAKAHELGKVLAAIVEPVPWGEDRWPSHRTIGRRTGWDQR